MTSLSWNFFLKSALFELFISLCCSTIPPPPLFFFNRWMLRWDAVFCCEAHSSTVWLVWFAFGLVPLCQKCMWLKCVSGSWQKRCEFSESSVSHLLYLPFLALYFLLLLHYNHSSCLSYLHGAGVGACCSAAVAPSTCLHWSVFCLTYWWQLLKVLVAVVTAAA